MRLQALPKQNAIESDAISRLNQLIFLSIHFLRLAFPLLIFYVFSSGKDKCPKRAFDRHLSAPLLESARKNGIPMAG